MSESPPNPSDADLLQRYVRSNDQSAFQSLAARHLQWIYSAALRQTRNPVLAEEVAQGVLISLSQKARSLQHHPALASWLFRATRYGALALLRAEKRRKHHEESAMPKSSIAPTDPAWSDLEPHIDSALGRLSESDRRILLLRFYQQLTHTGVAATLNITEEAARKRTDRALEKLRSLLKVSSPAVLPTMLSTKLLLPLPPALVPVLPALTPSALLAAKGIQTMFILHNLKIAAAILLLAAVPAAVTTVILAEKSSAQSPPPAPLFAGTSTILPTTQPFTRDAIHSYTLSTYQLDPVSNGKPRLVTQIFFDLDHGNLDKHFLAPDRILSSLDDGIHHYTFRSGNVNAVVTPSTMPPSSRRAVLQAYLDFFTQTLGPRHPEMDDTAANEKLSCYEWDNPAPLKGTSPMSYVWLDSQGLPRATTTITPVPATNLSTLTRLEITYNPDIPADTWKLPAGVIPIDPVATLDNLFPLSKALASIESPNRIFAVHQYGQDKNGTLYCVYSLRLPQKTIDSLGPAINALSSDLFSQLSAGNDYKCVSIATVRTLGAQVYFVALVPQQPNPAPPTLTIHFHTIPTTKQPDQEATLTITPPAPTPSATLDSLINDIFNLDASWGGIFEIQLFAYNHRHSLTNTPPENWTRESYKEELLTRLIAPQ